MQNIVRAARQQAQCRQPIESVPAVIAMVELAATDPNRCAILCANLGGDTDTIGAMAVAIYGALHGIDAIDTQLKAELDVANALDFTHYSRAFVHFRQQREAAYADA
ncbi:ADP-ribosylation/Crystallin J1 [Plautia stali symbiont]|nr:ADP-ribosylation/Crystallin J1 [Plautia stali symbiont]